MNFREVSKNYKGFIVIFCCILFYSNVDARQWTNQSGSAISGELIAVKDTRALIQRDSDGRQFWIPLETLIPADQKFISEALKDPKYETGWSVPLSSSMKRNLKVYYAFNSKDLLGKDSSGTRGQLGTGDCKMDWSENGLIGGAASFNGRNSVFRVKHFMQVKNQPLTISVWIKTNNKGEQEIISFGGLTTGLALYTKNRTAGYVYRWGARKNLAEVKQNSYDVTNGEWHHICAVSDDKGNLSIWVNGDKAGPKSAQMMPKEPLWGATIGDVSNSREHVRNTRTTKPFEGLIDEFMAFHWPFDEAEVKELYKSYKEFARN